jgi:hypothetical protein
MRIGMDHQFLGACNMVPWESDSCVWVDTCTRFPNHWHGVSGNHSDTLEISHVRVAAVKTCLEQLRNICICEQLPRVP